VFERPIKTRIKSPGAIILQSALRTFVESEVTLTWIAAVGPGKPWRPGKSQVYSIPLQPQPDDGRHLLAVDQAARWNHAGRNP
jgi:hypothetical protein